MRRFVVAATVATFMASAVGQGQTDRLPRIISARGGDSDGGSIHGAVVGRATVTLKLLPEVKTVAVTETDPKGAFEFRAVMPGRYLVSIEASGYTLKRLGIIVEAGTEVALREVTMERDLPCPSSAPPTPNSQAEQPIKTTLCEIMKAPDRFSGKIVQFRASVYHGFEASFLRDETHTIWLDAGFPMTMTAPFGSESPQREMVLQKDAAYQEMNRYLHAFYADRDSVVCDRCPLYKVTVDAIGLFEHVDQLTMGFGQGKHVGFGHMSGYESRLVLQSVSKVEAAPIDPSLYQRRP